MPCMVDTNALKNTTQPLFLSRSIAHRLPKTRHNLRFPNFCWKFFTNLFKNKKVFYASAYFIPAIRLTLNSLPCFFKNFFPLNKSKSAIVSGLIQKLIWLYYSNIRNKINSSKWNKINSSKWFKNKKIRQTPSEVTFNTNQHRINIDSSQRSKKIINK